MGENGPQTGDDAVERPPPASLLHHPVHEVAAWLFVVATIVTTAPVIELKPLMELVGLTGLLGASLLFAPRGTVSRLRIAISALLYLMVLLVSVTWSPSTELWWSEVRFSALSLIGMTVVVSILPRRGLTSALMVGMYALVASTVFVGLTDPSTHQGVGGAGWRGPFGHKNPMGAFMAISIVTAQAFDHRPVRRRLVTVTALILIVLSQSTTALSLLLIAVPTLWSMRQFGRVTPQRAAIRFVTVAGLSLVLTVMTLLQAPVVLGAAGKESTLTGRTEIWEASVPLIRERPVLGWGPGVWVRRGVSPAADINTELGVATAHAHNVVIETLLTLGVVGLAALLVFWVSTIRAGWRAALRGSDIGAWTVAIGMIVGVWGVAEVLNRTHIALLTLGLTASIAAVSPRGRPVGRADPATVAVPSGGSIVAADVSRPPAATTPRRPAGPATAPPST